jgi:hypothetical protein
MFKIQTIAPLHFCLTPFVFNGIQFRDFSHDDPKRLEADQVSLTKPILGLGE